MNRRSLLPAAAALVTLVAACGKKADESGNGPAAAPFPTAATLGEQTVLTAAEYLETEPYASADRSKGERQAVLCKACHSLERGGPNMIGPALRNADFVWTPEALDAWLAQPGRFLPGNRMTFAGVPDREDRANLIAYLLESTTTER